MIEIINKANGTTYTAKNVFGLTKKVVKSVKDDNEWINIFDAFEEVAASLEDVSQYFVDKQNTPTCSIRSLVFHDHFIGRVEKLAEDSLLRTTLLPLAEQNVEMTSNLNRLSEANVQTILNLGREVMVSNQYLPSGGTSLIDEQVLFDKYPMMQLVGTSLMNHAKEVFEYVDMIDNS